VLGVLLDIVGAEDVLHEQESVVVGVGEGRRVVEDGDVGVDHLIVTDEQDRGSVDALFTVRLWYGSRLSNGAEVLADSVRELLVENIAGTDDHDVVAEVVGGLVMCEVFGLDSLELIGVTLDWLTEHMVTERVEMGILNSGRVIVPVVEVMLGGNLLLLEFQLRRVEACIANCIAEHLNGSSHVVSHDSERKVALLTACFRIELTSHLLDVGGKILLGSR